MTDDTTATDTTMLKSVGVAKDTRLEVLGTIVVQMEQQLGPLTNLGHGPLMQSDGSHSDQDVTVLVFDMAQAPPSDNAFLRMCIGNQPPTVAGATLIVTGQCYVSGQLMMIAAFRPQ